MTVYLIADIQVTNDAWLPDYVVNVHDLVHNHGGKYLSRSGNIMTIEGKELETTVVALIEFPSMETAQEFINDPAYAKYRQARQAGSISNLHFIDDTDIAGTIPYLSKG